MRYSEKEETRISNIEAFLLNCGRVIILATVALLPLFVLPQTLEYEETAKGALLLFSTLSLSSIIIIHMSVKRTVEIIRTGFGWILAFLILEGMISTFFSHYLVTSLFGYSGRWDESVLVVIALALLVYAITYFFQGELGIYVILYTIIISGLILSFVSIVPPSFLHINSELASPLGNNVYSGYALLLPLMISLVLIILSIRTVALHFSTLSMMIGNTCAICFLTVGIGATGVSYIVLLPFIVGFIVFLFVELLSDPKSVPWTVILGILVGSGIGASIFLHHAQSSTTLLPVQTTFQIIWSQFHSIKDLLIGSGPDTFYFSFFTYIPVSFFKSNLYAYQFTSAPSAYLQLLSTQGSIGFGLFVVFLVAIWLMIRRILRVCPDKDSRLLIAGIGGVAALLTAMLIVIPYLLTIIAMIFVCAGLLSIEYRIYVRQGRGQIRLTVDSEDGKAGYGRIIGGSVASTLLLGVGVLLVYHMQTLIIYTQGVHAQQLSDEYASIVSAYEREPFMDLYLRDVSRVSGDVAADYYAKASSSTGSEKNAFQDATRSFSSQAETKAFYDVAAHPTDPLALSNEASVLFGLYRNAGSDKNYLLQAQDVAVYEYNLYPTNIFIMNSLGQIYLAENQFSKALTMYQLIHAENGFDPTLQYNYGLALEGVGQKKQAVGVYQEILATPSLPPRTINLLKTRIAANSH